MFETLFLHCVDRLGCVREEGIGGRDPEAKPVLKGKAQAPNPGEKLDPREEKPGHCTAQSREEVFPEEKVEREETGDQEREGAEFACREMAATPEGRGEHHQTDDEEEFPHDQRA